MTRKRKACEALDEAWGVGEIGDKAPVGTVLEEAALTPTLATSQVYNPEATGVAIKNTQQHLREAVAMAYMCGQGSEVVDDPSNDPNNHLGKNPQAEKNKMMPQSKLLKKMSINCEWNMCTAVFNKMERFITHITEHLRGITVSETNDGFLCYWRDCDFACTTKDEMDRHVYFHAFHSKIKSIGLLLMEERNEKCILDSSGRNMVPEIPEAFQCMWEDCAVKFASAHDFYCHVLGHVLNTEVKGKGRKAFVCSWDVCTSTFAVRIRLRDHVRSHTQEKVVGCPNCGGIYASNTKLFDHCIRQMPLEAQQYQCSHCSRRYATERMLRDHVRHHINHFKCPECDMTVPNKSALAAHVRYRHRKDKPHKCLQCGRGFTCLTDITRHLTVHSAEPAYSCPYQNCDTKYRSQSSLNRHIRSFHNGLQKDHYACHVCDKRFCFGGKLTKHLIKIHNFEWPVGHTRFRYKQDEDGFYRLQTVRYESIELNQEVLSEEGEEDEEEVDSPEAFTVVSSPASHRSQLLPRETAVQQSTKSDNDDSKDLQQLLGEKHTQGKVIEHQEIIMPSKF